MFKEGSENYVEDTNVFYFIFLFAFLDTVNSFGKVCVALHF